MPSSGWFVAASIIVGTGGVGTIGGLIITVYKLHKNNIRTRIIESESASKVDVQRLTELFNENKSIIATYTTDNGRLRDELNTTRKSVETMRTKMESCYEERLNLKMDVESQRNENKLLTAKVEDLNSYISGFIDTMNKVSPDTYKAVRDALLKDKTKVS